MKIYWAGSTPPPEGLPFIQVANLDDLHEHALVFIDDPTLINDDIDTPARIYLVTEDATLQDVPEEVAGIVPRDIRAIQAIAELYRETRDMFSIGDKLIASLTEKNQAIQEKQAALLHESKKHTAIIKHASDLIFLLGSSGKIMFCNDTTTEYLCPDESAVGKAFADFAVAADRENVHTLLAAGFQEGHPSHLDVRLNLASGKTGIFSLMTTPLKEHRHVYALSVIGRDVTEMRAMQTRLAIQAKDFECMTKGLAHELRNPLTILGAYLIKMGAEDHSREFQPKYEAMMSSLTRIEHMVARIERYESIANQKSCFTRVEIGRLIQEATESPEFPVPVTIKIWDETCAYTDPLLLKIALNRALENAVECGSPAIEVHSSRHEGYAYIMVRDYGPGIQEDPKAIFAPFFSTDPMKVGLGLTEARLAMVKIGGEIELIPQADPGAIFLFKLHLDRRQIPRSPN